MQILHRRLHFRGGWTLPDDCKAWWSVVNSGAVAKLGTWTNAAGAYGDMTLAANCEVTVAAGGLVNPGSTGNYAQATITGLSNSAGTVSVWAKRAGNGTGTTEYIFGALPAANNRYYIATDRSGTVFAETRFDNVAFSNIGNITDGVWYHMALTWDATKWYNYFNGTPVTSGSATNTTAPSVVQLTNLAGNNVQFNGTVDDCFLFARCLTDAQIAYLYTTSPGKH